MEVLQTVGPVVSASSIEKWRFLWTVGPVVSASSIGKWRFYRQWVLWSVKVV